MDDSSDQPNKACSCDTRDMMAIAAECSVTRLRHFKERAGVTFPIPVRQRWRRRTPVVFC